MAACTAVAAAQIQIAVLLSANRGVRSGAAVGSAGFHAGIAAMPMLASYIGQAEAYPFHYSDALCALAFMIMPAVPNEHGACKAIACGDIAEKRKGRSW